MSEKSFYGFLAVLAATAMAILSAATIGQVHNNINLRAELVATRAVMDSAAVLARDNNGWTVASREGGYHFPANGDYETVTRVRVVFPNGTTKQFLIFHDGTVVVSDRQPNVAPLSRASIADYNAEEQVGTANIANWGNTEKWR